MSAEDAFLDALLADPTDFETRLVFADWLEDRGDPRGEFLRVQTELARWVPDHRRRNELLTRERQLLADHEAEWLGPLREFCFPPHWEGGLATITIHPVDVTHRAVRGFLTPEFEHIANPWLRRAWVGTVRIIGASGLWEAVAGCESLAWVTALDLEAEAWFDEALGVLLSSPHLRRLVRLNLANNALTVRGITALCTSPVLSRLKWLDLRNNLLDSSDLQPLLASLDQSQLRWADLHGNDLNRPTLSLLATWREQHAGPLSRQFTNSVGMDFTLIPAGTFLMGSPESEPQRYNDEGPQHEVILPRSWYFGKYAVTQRQYEWVMGTNPSHFRDGAMDLFNCPVENVSWLDAVEFCRRLSEFPEEKRRGRCYRLPTEAEWEYACRAGGMPSSPFDLGNSLSSYQANFNGKHPYGGESEGPYLERTVSVGSYGANAFGLFDMHGNVWEWCADGMDHDFYRKSPPVDPVAPHANDQRVCRGGSWHSPGHYCRSADRGDDRLDVHDSYYGFRVACDFVGPS